MAIINTTEKSKCWWEWREIGTLVMLQTTCSFSSKKFSVYFLRTKIDSYITTLQWSKSINLTLTWYYYFIHYLYSNFAKYPSKASNLIIWLKRCLPVFPLIKLLFRVCKFNTLCWQLLGQLLGWWWWWGAVIRKHGAWEMALACRELSGTPRGRLGACSLHPLFQLCGPSSCYPFIFSDLCLLFTISLFSWYLPHSFYSSRQDPSKIQFHFLCAS